MKTAHPEPTIYDRVKVDTEQQCPMYRGDEPEPCDNSADFVFVYEKQSGTDKRDNCLACSACCPVPDSAL